MRLFSKKYEVKPNCAGFLYRNNKLHQELDAGIYSLCKWPNNYMLLNIPLVTQMVVVTNQEVLSKDNIAFRFSYFVLYKIRDAKMFLSHFALDKTEELIIAEAEQRINAVIQIEIRNRISTLDSELLNEQRVELTDLRSESMKEQINTLGVDLEQVQLRDISFPKNIQDLFSKHLEAKIRAQSDLENARTVVATARTLKNAATMMKDDDNMRFVHYMETLSKIAQNGKNTFVIGDMSTQQKK